MATKNDQDSTAAKGLINDIFGIKINKNKVRKNFDVINNYLEGRKLLKERLDVKKFEDKPGLTENSPADKLFGILREKTQTTHRRKTGQSIEKSNTNDMAF